MFLVFYFFLIQFLVGGGRVVQALFAPTLILGQGGEFTMAHGGNTVFIQQ